MENRKITKWIEIFNLSGVRFRQAVEETYTGEGYRTKMVDRKGFDKVEIQVGNNYGNPIITDKSGGNKVYRYLKANLHLIDTGVLGSFDTLRVIQTVLGMSETVR